MDAPSPNYSEFQKPLENFRASARRVRVHPAEQVVLWWVSIHLVLLPWLLGAQRVWTQIPSVCVALVGLLIALVPRNYTEEHTGSNRFRLIMWPKLLKFPLFWLGLALLVLVAIQGLNTPWSYSRNTTLWWMDPHPHVKWLPTGVRVPFERWGPWRMLIIYASVWLTVCTIWVGFTRRRTLQTFFLVLAGNGIGLAALGIAQSERVLGNGKIFWFFTSSNPSFFSSFIYKNHGAAYVFLALVLTCGIAAWYYVRGLRRMEKSNPAGVFAFFATCIAAALMISNARGITLVMLAFIAVLLGVFIVHQLFVPGPHRKPAVALALIVIFGGFLLVGARALKPQAAFARIVSGMSRQDSSLAGRELATKASIEMLGDYWVRGAGAGSFEFLFPKYQHRYRDLVIIDDGRSRQFWQHAHNDIVEFPIEFGVAGMLLVLAAFGYLGTQLVKGYFWENPLSATLVFGLVLVIAYSWWDFPFHCVAVLGFWWALAIAVVMWTNFEESNVKG